MRKAAEATNNVRMQFRPFQIFDVCNRFEERNTAFLIGEIFRVLERKAKESPHVGWNLAVEAAYDGTRSDGACQRVGHEGPRVATKHIARELVEKDQKGESALRVLLPASHFSSSRSFVGVEKSLADFFVECGVLVKPPVRPCRAPERHYFICSRGHSDHMSIGRRPARLITQCAPQDLADI